MPTWLITGANRGLGLEFVTQLSKDVSNTIIATSRSMSRETLAGLEALDIKSRLHILECDTSSPSSIEALGKDVSSLLNGGDKIDFLLNNAGVNVASQLTSLTVTPEAILENVKVNVIGPAKIVQVLEGHLKQGAVVMNMTSGLGSMADTRATETTKCTAYSISKAGLNMLTLHQASHLREKGVVVVCVDPGWVKTALGGEGAIMEKEDSIKGMLKCLKGLKPEDSGKFFAHDGREKAW
ncbi:hypothetical protein V500_07167 [Pseudogymnoascus sp. VKM F-4518 (FW-2643)]|nr:hypothetical protein V500_07167 [Pseudogymnoascus sp. VKM F-4518 (FW-2643)]